MRSTKSDVTAPNHRMLRRAAERGLKKAAQVTNVELSSSLNGAWRTTARITLDSPIGPIDILARWADGGWRGYERGEARAVAYFPPAYGGMLAVDQVRLDSCAPLMAVHLIATHVADRLAL